MTTQKWRFPDNNYTSENGLDTSDMEMFKKDPVSSLAREICQNSIDAAFGEKPVRVEFSLFQVARGEVPGVDDLAAQIDACYKYKKDSPKEEPTLRELKKSISRDTITCLRVSDFNTSGIFGVKVNKSGVPFYDLTKGSGVSNKGGSSGGSKGIGKFASFVVSTTNTVFYSTKANDGTSGFIGISKLRSAPIPGKDENLLTLGVGYYAETEKNLPILRELHLDKGFVRSENQYGTDVYIIGFNNFKGWQYDIIAKVLESFMVAVMCGGLEVIVDGIVVNQNTVSSIIYAPWRHEPSWGGGRGRMSKIHIKYMTDEALATVKANTDAITGKLIENPKSSSWLKDFFPGTLWVTKKYEIEEFALRVPKDDKDRETDIYNSILLYEHLRHLPLYVLTDERFWCWINFEIGYEVALKYMPVKKGSSVFKDHWLLTQGKRRGLFFGVLSRCYFRVALSIDETLDDPYELAKFVIENPLRFRELTWRSFSSEKMIVIGTLKAEMRVMGEYPQAEENTKHFAEIAKSLSKLGSVMLLDCMTEKDIEEYVYKKYKRMIEEDLANRGLFDKLKDAVIKVFK